jgi:hypothetical protein
MPASVPGEVSVIFLPSTGAVPRVKAIEPDAAYRAFLFDPKDGREWNLGTVTPDGAGDWRPPLSSLPIFQDWLLVLERRQETA